MEGYSMLHEGERTCESFKQGSEDWLERRLKGFTLQRQSNCEELNLDLRGNISYQISPQNHKTVYKFHKAPDRIIGFIIMEDWIFNDMTKTRSPPSKRSKCVSHTTRPLNNKYSKEISQNNFGLL